MNALQSKAQHGELIDIETYSRNYMAYILAEQYEKLLDPSKKFIIFDEEQVAKLKKGLAALNDAVRDLNKIKDETPLRDK